MLFVGYPRCSTSNKARKWLVDNNISFDERHIKDERPTIDELKKWHAMSGLPLKRFFNTSGMLYRDMQLASKLPNMSDEDQFKLLATDGLLVKRPILVGDNFVLVGFREKEWTDAVL